MTINSIMTPIDNTLQQVTPGNTWGNLRRKVSTILDNSELLTLFEISIQTKIIWQQVSWKPDTENSNFELEILIWNKNRIHLIF